MLLDNPADFALLLDRLAVGAFFAISGYHKVFNPARHAALVEILKLDNIPCVRFNQWFVPWVELGAGSLLVVGFMSSRAALLLGVICLVATCMDGPKRVKEYKPLDAADWLDDILYLPEVLLGIMLVIVILCGPGRHSLDFLM